MQRFTPYLLCIALVSALSASTLSYGQSTLPDSCKIAIGTNLAGMFDWGTELPFVDRMHNAREWYTKDVVGGPWSTDLQDSLVLRADGYPVSLPQMVNGHPNGQIVATIWAELDGWDEGVYTVLYEGEGELAFWGAATNLIDDGNGRITFDLDTAAGGNALEMRINRSEASDPIRNIRVLMPGTETTYMDQPFNPVWLDHVRMFRSVRFMDWGQTNNWGQKDWTDWDSPELYDWDERQRVDHYTYAHNKGVPYEWMIDLMNQEDLDGWVCVPYRASPDYIRQMAQLFHDNLEPERTLTVEYSNENWNWLFGQAAWCNKYGELETGLPWPENTVGFVQRALDIWTEVYGADTTRIKRVVGVQTGWPDVAQRTVFSMRPGSFDAVAPTFYFGLGEDGDAALDVLEASATAADVAYWARENIREEATPYLREIKETIADVLEIPMLFYEGGQHLTGSPFGEVQSYDQALLDIQRDTALYNIYNEWFDTLRTMQVGDEPLQLQHFSLVTGRSGRYGSWGMLETMHQDTSLIPAPKFRAVAEVLASDCEAGVTSNSSNLPLKKEQLMFYPNPAADQVSIVKLNGDSPVNIERIEVFTLSGKLVKTYSLAQNRSSLDISALATGMYLVVLSGDSGVQTGKLVVE